MTLRGSTGSSTGRSQIEDALFTSPNERYARNALAMFASLILFTTMAVVVPERDQSFQRDVSLYFCFVCSVVFLMLSRLFRRRAFYDWQRRSETMEDERDLAILAAGDRVFRTVASCWVVALACAAAVWSSQAPVLSGVRLGGLMLLGVMAANLAGHAMVLWRYRQQRR